MSTRFVRWAAAAVLVLPISALSPLGQDPVAEAFPSSDGPGGDHRTGLPAGMPPAAYMPEPALPAATGWPFGEWFPKTSGVGRLKNGALYWTDFLYDDFGARGLRVQSPNPRGGGTHTVPTGTYSYASPHALGNAADVFRVAIGSSGAATYWRVDWNTLTERSGSAAAFLLDTDRSDRTGFGTLPANIGGTAKGTDVVLLLTTEGAWLIDTNGQRRLPDETLTVDLQARSFVLRTPREVLPVHGSWTVGLVAGVAEGAGFASVGLQHGALPGQPNVYNMAFRARLQELAHTQENPWMEAKQAADLARGDLTDATVSLEWEDLLQRRATPEPMPTGYSNRWYVSNRDFGQGVNALANGTTDLTTVALPGRVQPYGIYVPSSYSQNRPAPLTWLLHGGAANHNQWSSYSPKFLQQACEQRSSICVSPGGRGPWNWALLAGELDFWEVWNRVASDYSLDHDRTALAGASMGGYEVFYLGFNYPHLFAAAAAIAPAVKCAGIEFLPPSGDIRGGTDSPDGDCHRNGDTSPLVENAEHLPFGFFHGAVDELVPVLSVQAQVDRFDSLGYRYLQQLHGTEGHLVYILKRDGFSDVARYLARETQSDRPSAPRSIRYSFYSGAFKPDLGVGPSGAWWLSDLRARTVEPALLARISATSHARPGVGHTVSRSTLFDAYADPSPALIRQLSWAPTSPLAQDNVLALNARNIGDATLDTAAAGLTLNASGLLDLHTDGPVRIILTGLAAASDVRSAAGHVWQADAGGRATVELTGGTHELRFHR